ncbi:MULTISPECIES: (deoxy)nucleoside triphosphate pyrophosphohydrolase [Fusobacterium]|uniref:(deoxy)nucleoside triphosphate pyrophosphohydrolase n=1 Tax=Fusobacterium TaxID=848 RepID=UPI001476CC51|nr:MULTISPECIES: (deoxy)nucleoside triphosphate pyrophosphohydrolase [Fusobacterium]NME36624.1 (deoxy)nucleoside triphosphate pyrophosphohydrolase [Fusobacterium sp. FSA-380-WT-3A]
MEKIIDVVAAIIENEKNEILCTLRPENKILGNNWEFPGGKLEKGESYFQGIVREIKEELDCDIEPLKIIGNAYHKYERGTVNIIAIKCKLLSKIELKEHSALIWLKRENLKSLVWAPADIEIIEKYLL